MTMPSVKLLDLGIDGFAVALDVDLKDANPLATVPIAISSGDTREEAIDRAELFLQRCIVAVHLIP
jgi:hypothetical protein